jgi:polar amino acid transport system substrate-binding protein
MSARLISRKICGVTAVLAASVVVAACSNSGTVSPGKPAGSVGGTAAPLNGMLPAAIRSKGAISVASLADLAPWSFQKGGKWTGIDVDLTNALSKKLGVSFNYANIDFAGEIPGLQAGRFDLIINEIGDNLDREKVISFASYGTDSTGIIVRAGNPKHIKTITDLCGAKVAVVPASLPTKQAEAQAKKCAASGAAALTTVSVPTMAATYLAVQSGRVDATLNGYSATAYAMQTGGAATSGLELAPGRGFQPGLLGIAFAKNDLQLGKAIQAALNAIIADGEYAAIFKKWKVSTLMIGHSEINGAAAFNKANPGHI